MEDREHAVIEDTLEEGQRAYDQARAFEALRRRRLPLVYTLFTLLLASLSCAAFVLHHFKIGPLCLISAVLFGAFSAFNWRKLHVQYEQNVALLAGLEAEHGATLPWLQVERHLAQMEKLKAELEEESEEGSGA